MEFQLFETTDNISGILQVMAATRLPLQPLPSLDARDVFGNIIDFNKLNDDYILLVFLRYAGCPWCNLAIHRLTLEHDELTANNCKVIAFVQSDPDSIKSNIYDRHNPQPPFPIIPDVDRTFYKMYGIGATVKGVLGALVKIPYWMHSVRELGYKQTEIDGDFFLVPGWFLYSKRSNKIVRSQRGISLYDHAAFLNIYDSLYFKDETDPTVE